MRHSSTASRLITRTVAYAATLALLGWASTSVDRADTTSDAAGVRPSINAHDGVKTANLLVPKRTRLVIKYERTAVC